MPDPTDDPSNYRQVPDKSDPGADEPPADDGQLRDANWLHFNAECRAAHVAAVIAAGRYLDVCRQPHDDSLMDLMAAVRAVRHEDMDALAVVLRHGSVGQMLITAVKLLAEAADEQQISSEFLTVWSSFAVARD